MVCAAVAAKNAERISSLGGVGRRGRSSMVLHRFWVGCRPCLAIRTGLGGLLVDVLDHRISSSPRCDSLAIASETAASSHQQSHAHAGCRPRAGVQADRPRQVSASSAAAGERNLSG